jgi:prefoldin subunit 5
MIYKTQCYKYKKIFKIGLGYWLQINKDGVTELLQSHSKPLSSILTAMEQEITGEE